MEEEEGPEEVEWERERFKKFLLKKEIDSVEIEKVLLIFEKPFKKSKKSIRHAIHIADKNRASLIVLCPKRMRKIKEIKKICKSIGIDFKLIQEEPSVKNIQEVNGEEEPDLIIVLNSFSNLKELRKVTKQPLFIVE